jgi:hypothetical protein
MPEAEGRDMEEVLTWLFNDGSSSIIGAEAEGMSVASLQVRYQPPRSPSTAKLTHGHLT